MNIAKSVSLRRIYEAKVCQCSLWVLCHKCSFAKTLRPVRLGWKKPCSGRIENPVGRLEVGKFFWNSSSYRKFSYLFSVWLDVDRLSIEYVAHAFETARLLSGLHRHVRNQWLRAAQSISHEWNTDMDSLIRVDRCSSVANNCWSSYNSLMGLLSALQ